jgi:hypothetical protein
MTTLHLIKTSSGAFVPATEEDAAAAKRFRVGEVSRVELKAMRNGAFFRKYFALLKIAFDMWAETQPAQEYHGRSVLPDFDRFRRDVTIMAGFFRPVWNARGELRVEAESIAWSSMTEERFEKLYSATINVILQKILPGRGLTEQGLRDWAMRVLEFAA